MELHGRYKDGRKYIVDNKIPIYYYHVYIEQGERYIFDELRGSRVFGNKFGIELYGNRINTGVVICVAVDKWEQNCGYFCSYCIKNSKDIFSGRIARSLCGERFLFNKEKHIDAAESDGFDSYQVGRLVAEDVLIEAPSKELQKLSQYGLILTNSDDA